MGSHIPRAMQYHRGNHYAESSIKQQRLMDRSVDKAFCCKISKCVMLMILHSNAVSADEKGNVWSFNYFFYNRKLKRMLYFSCRGLSKTAEDSRNTSSGAFLLDQRSDGEVDKDDAATMYGMANTMEI